MKNSEYIKENHLEEQFKRYIDEKCNEAYNRLKKETTINMKPALTKDEKILLTNSTNITLTLEAIREGRILKKEFGDKAEDEQRKKIKKILNKIEKQREEELKETRIMNKIQEVKAANQTEKKGLFSKFFSKKETTNMTLEEALALEKEYLQKQDSKENESSTIETVDKDKEYAVLYYLNGEALEYAKKVLEANFINDHKTYNENI